MEGHFALSPSVLTELISDPAFTLFPGLQCFACPRSPTEHAPVEKGRVKVTLSLWERCPFPGSVLRLLDTLDHALLCASIAHVLGASHIKQQQQKLLHSSLFVSQHDSLFSKKTFNIGHWLSLGINRHVSRCPEILDVLSFCLFFPYPWQNLLRPCK